MAIWATLDDYLPAHVGQDLVGRSVANYDFLTALLRYSHFDAFHFFLTNQAHINAFIETHKEKFDAQGSGTDKQNSPQTGALQVAGHLQARPPGGLPVQIQHPSGQRQRA